MAQGLLPRAPRGHPLVLPVLPFKLLLMGFKALWLCQHKARGGPAEALLPPAMGPSESCSLGSLQSAHLHFTCLRLSLLFDQCLFLLACIMGSMVFPSSRFKKKKKKRQKKKKRLSYCLNGSELV